jgi:hypothetical protein
VNASRPNLADPTGRSLPFLPRLRTQHRAASPSKAERASSRILVLLRRERSRSIGGEQAPQFDSFAPRTRGAALTTLVAAIAVSGAFWLLPSVAQAFTIHSFSATPTATQAGGHPDLNLDFETDFHGGPQLAPGNNCECNDTKNLDIHLPTGFIGNPHATPQCTAADFARETCPADSQIGTAGAVVPGVFSIPNNIPLDNLVPKPGQAGLIALQLPVIGAPIYVVLNARTGSDYGLDTDIEGITHFFGFAKFEITIWGVPANPSHDALRRAAEGGRGVPSGSPETPFLQNPTTCGTSLSSGLDILAYNGESASAESPWPEMIGCDQLGFNPSNFVQPTTTETDSPSGVALEINVPQDESPSVPSASEIRGTTVTLPPGFVLSPNASDGKTSCTNAEASFGTLNEAHCPEFAKIGTVEIDSPSLPAPLPGYLYIGEPRSGERYRFIITADGFSVHVKLLGASFPDPQTGQQVVSFQNLPQFPFSAFKLHFFGSERGILETPTQCGTYPVKTTFTPWDAALPEQTSTQFFSLDSGPGGTPCPGPTRPFDPSFQAGSVNNTAGSHTPFSIDLTRSDGDQNLTGLSVSTPPGLLATLKGIPYCPDASIAAAAQPSYSGLAEQQSPSCSSASQIGTAIAGAGSGTHPVYFQGEVYLAGPYKGAPLSLAVITPALSGPYDLGNVVVRAALHVNPETIQITAVSDPLPQILQGIPLRYREVLIELNRPNFTLNPTNCDLSSVSTTVTGDQGAQANLSSPFQPANCATLPFAPNLALKLSGATRRAGHPAVSATVTYPKAPYANIAKAQVSLPHSEFLDQAHIGTVCTRPQLAAEQCPAASVYGHAQVETPLLEKPLEGPVYLGTGYGTKLPELIADLNGQIHVILRGKVTTDSAGGIRSTFEAVPDAPVSKFTLSLDGGKKGLLENSENLCAKPQRVTADFTGQNGKADDYRTLISNSCRSKGKSKRKKANTSGRTR